jgi:hypothetical protein
VAENASENVTVLSVYKSCLWESLHRLPGDFSIRQIRDSTAPSRKHFLLPSRLSPKTIFSIRFVLSVVISWIFAESQWTICPGTPVGALVVLAKFPLPEPFEHSGR